MRYIILFFALFLSKQIAFSQSCILRNALDDSSSVILNLRINEINDTFFYSPGEITISVIGEIITDYKKNCSNVKVIEFKLTVYEDDVSKSIGRKNIDYKYLKIGKEYFIILKNENSQFNLYDLWSGFKEFDINWDRMLKKLTKGFKKKD